MIITILIAISIISIVVWFFIRKESREFEIAMKERDRQFAHRIAEKMVEYLRDKAKTDEYAKAILEKIKNYKP